MLITVQFNVPIQVVAQGVKTPWELSLQPVYQLCEHLGYQILTPVGERGGNFMGLTSFNDFKRAANKSGHRLRYANLP